MRDRRSELGGRGMLQGVVFPDPPLLVEDTSLFNERVFGRQCVVVLVPVTSSTSTWGTEWQEARVRAGGEESTEEDNCLLVRRQGETIFMASDREQVLTGVVVSEREV